MENQAIKAEELEVVGKMLYATSISDRKRIFSLIDRARELACEYLEANRGDVNSLVNYILIRIDPTLMAFELDGYKNTIEDFKRQLKIVLSDFMGVEANRVQPEVKQLLAELVELEKKTTQGEWRTKSFEDEDDPFIERPRVEGEAYGREIMSDEKYATKKADAEFIVGAKRIAKELSKQSV